jgi:Flp pilus assembly protein TadB
VQNAVIGIIVGASFLGLALMALQSKRRAAIGLQLALGIIVGALAAGVAVAMRSDLVPDDIEAPVAAAVVVLTAVALILVVARYQAR